MMETSREPRCVADCGMMLGEGPVWVDSERSLYWLDILAPAIFRLREQTGAITRWLPPYRIGAIAPAARGGFVAGTEKGFALIYPEHGDYRLLHHPEAHLPANRFNDGKVDRQGRFWAGTMDESESEPLGALYRLDPDLRSACIDSGYRVTNGPAFDPAGKQLYHTDSAARIIYLFDLGSDGNVSNKRIFKQFDAQDGHPDGMTVDAEGCLWVAFWDGWCLRRFAPDGSMIERIALPVQRPTSCAFGGPHLDRLFVTSARIGLDEAALASQPSAGALFALQPGVRGVTERPFG